MKVANVGRLAFKNKNDVSSFWFSLHDKNPLLSKKASVMLIQPAKTYLCKSGFSVFATIKTKSGNLHNNRLALSKMVPDVKDHVKEVQEHVLH